MTLVSIVTPSFNQAPFLETTMRSVLEQEHKDLEYIVVDGGSTDGSRDIIGRYANRLAWWVSERDEGQAEAINKGFGRAQGEIAAWLNSDDAYLPGAIGAAVRAFEEDPAAVMVYADMQAIDEQGRKINVLKYRQLSLEDLLCFQIIGQPSVFFRRSAFEAAGGLDRQFQLLLDHQLWIKLAKQGPIAHVEQTWASARYHLGAKNLTRAAEFGGEAARILEWAGSDPVLAKALRPVRGRARASAWRVDARYLLDAGRPASSLKSWARALLIDPPTALARLNIAASAVLELTGLGSIRRSFLRNRQKRLSS